MASYRQRGKGWTAQVRMPDGTFRTKAFPTKKQAQVWAVDIEAKRDRGIVRDPRKDDATFADLWPTFLDKRDGLLSPATLSKNRTHWRQHLEPAFGDTRVVTLRRSHVEAWVARRSRAGVGAPTLEAAVRLLSALCEYAVDDDVIPANPVRKVKSPAHIADRRAFVTAAEIDAVLAHVEDPRHRLLLRLMASTGLRIGEALGLQVRDIDGDAVHVRRAWTRHGTKETPKSSSSVRVVPLTADLAAALRAETASTLPATPIFHGIDDRNFSRRVLEPAVDAAGVERFTLHDLRKHAASTWVAAGLPLFEVARALGHRDTRMVEAIYGHLTPGAHDRLRAAMTSE